MQEVFLAATVPLTTEGWRPLEDGELVVAQCGRIVHAGEEEVEMVGRERARGQLGVGGPLDG